MASDAAPPTTSSWEHVAANTERLLVPGGWLYKVVCGEHMAVEFVPAPHSRSDAVSRPAGRRPKGAGISHDARNTVVSMLKAEGRPIRTHDLVERLRGQGVTVGGAPGREVVTLSGYLSRCPDVVPDRVRGWSLKEWTRNGAHG